MRYFKAIFVALLSIGLLAGCERENPPLDEESVAENEAEENLAVDEQDPPAERAAEQGEYVTSVSEAERKAWEGSINKEDVEVIGYTRIVSAPLDYAGATVTGTGTVTKLVSDRGLYLNVPDVDNDVFVVLTERYGEPEKPDLDVGDELKFTGLLLTAGAADDLVGYLEKDAKMAIDDAGHFVAIVSDTVNVL